MVGQFKILDSVGHGGMAEVYVGQHTVVDRRVAIKLIHPRHLDNPRMAKRFFNEARAVASLRHPGIVEFYDFGRADDGSPYLVMELLAGETLAARLEHGPLPLADAIAFGRQMASALGAAHERGIVHRDLKPANVFLVEDPDVPSGERVKILDFGIAKHTADREEITATGMMIGTPAHMSPEQCRGDKDIDGRADVYAFGVLLFHMVIGRLPFEGGTGEVVSRHLYEQVPRATRLNPDIPDALSDVIVKCMQKDRARRFASMAEVGAALAPIADEVDDELTPIRFPLGSQTRMTPAPIEVPADVPTPDTRSRDMSTATWPAIKATTGTRTLVDQRPRARAPAPLPLLVIAIAATLAVIAACVVALGDWPDDSSTVATPARVTAPPVRVTPPVVAAPEEPPQIVITEPEDRPHPVRAHESPPPARTKRAPARPVAPTPPPAPPKDPFADVATPAVY